MSSVEGLGTTEGRSPALVAALRKLLRPLVRLLLARRLTYPSLLKLLKEIYVEVALAELERGERTPTDSRISLMTGVHRKDVRRLRSEGRHLDSVPESVSRGAQVALRWVTDEAYLDAQGEPLPLPRVAAGVDGPTFDGLVDSISRDVRPRAVLDELLDLGVAQIDENGYVCLRVAGFVPDEHFDEKAFFFGRSVRDHIAAATHNLLGERPPMLERAVYYESLTEESVRELEELAEKTAMDALRTFNRRGATLRQRDAGRPGASLYVTLGAYFFQAPKGQD